MRDLREYFRPSSPEEAVALKQSYGAKAVYLGGGSDLLVHQPRGVLAAIDTRHAGMNEVISDDAGCVIGGAALLRDVEMAAGQVAGGMLQTAVRETAPWLIRNAATLAGNIANASPAADSVPALLALDATLELRGGSATASVEEILVGPHRNALGDRLIRFIRIPAEACRRRGVFIKVARSKSDIAQVNLAVTLDLVDGVARDVRIALGAVAPAAFRARESEMVVEGSELTPDTLDAAVRAVRDEVRPISDWRASAEYRRRMSGVYLRRALEEIAGLDERVRLR